MHPKLLVPISLALVTLGACNFDMGTSSAKATDGPDGSRIFAARDFTGVALKGSDNVVVREGANFAVTATGPQDQLDRLEISVKDGMLTVGRKRGDWKSSWNGKGVTVAVTMPRLDRAALGGSGNLEIAKARGDAVSAKLAGSGDLTIAEVETKALDLSVAGSGDLSITKGATMSGSYDIAGSGDVSAAEVTAATLELAIAGSGNISANASQTAAISIAGSGDVMLTGGAKCTTRKVGSGDVKCS